MSSKTKKTSNPPHVSSYSYKVGIALYSSKWAGFLIVSEASESNQSSACQVTVIHPRVMIPWTRAFFCFAYTFTSVAMRL